MQPATNIDSPQALAVWLARNGIDTTGWGTEGTKTTADLWRELQEGETTLSDDPPCRSVALAQIILRRGDLRLIELEQELRDGQRRSRKRPPSEKLHKGEAPATAALRCLHEELGISADQIGRICLSSKPTVTVLDSPSYPGLMTRFTIYAAEVEARDVPTEDFWRENVNAGASDPIVRHRWGWRPVEWVD